MSRHQVLVPRLLQAVISAIADYRFYKWNNNSKWSAFVIITSWFWFYTASRTLSNTLETSLTMIALSYYPRKASDGELKKSHFVIDYYLLMH